MTRPMELRAYAMQWRAIGEAALNAQRSMIESDCGGGIVENAMAVVNRCAFIAAGLEERAAEIERQR